MYRAVSMQRIRNNPNVRSKALFREVVVLFGGFRANVGDPGVEIQHEKRRLRIVTAINSSLADRVRQVELKLLRRSRNA